MRVFYSPGTLIWLSGFFFFFSLYITAPVIAAYAADLSRSVFFTGLAVGAYGAAMMLVRIPIGILASAHGRRKRLIQIGLFTIFVGLAAAFYGNQILLVVSRVLLGFGAGFWVLYTVLFASYFPKEKVGEAMSLITLAYALPQIFAALAGGLTAEYFGWLAPFAIGLISTIAAIVFISYVQESAVEEHRWSLAKTRQIISKKLFIVSLLAMVGFFVAFATVYGFTQNWAQDTLGATKQELGFILFAALIFYVLLLRFAARIANRFGVRRTLLLGMIALGLATSLIPLSKNIFELLVLQAFVGMGLGLIYPVTMAKSIEGIEEHLKDEAMGMYQSIYAAGIFLGPILGGIIASYFGLSWIFFVMGALSLASIPMLLFCRRL
ncbi:MAG: MFS transporter [Candidatus Spechtbacteria bacterium]|nr:MFS transporter [Candidatus Spechtbacteria bacterium]